MDLQTLSQVVGNIGLPGAILVYLIWRLDKFLTFLCGKLEIYNKEFGQITVGLECIVNEIKELKNAFLTMGKK